MKDRSMKISGVYLKRIAARAKQERRTIKSEIETAITYYCGWLDEKKNPGFWGGKNDHATTQ